MRARQSQPANPRPRLIAHRGASTEAPENTLAAFRRALALGVDGIELDVRLTRDGVPVVFHDATLARLTDRRGYLARLTLKELRAVRVHGENIPTLAEALALSRSRAVLQIEIKRGVPVAPIVRAIRRTGTTCDVVLASSEAAIVNEARRLAPQLPRMLIVGGGGPAPLQARTLVPVLAALGAAGVSLDHRVMRSPAFVAVLKRRGFSVWCWTVNDPRAMRRLATWGVDAILSDNPALLKSTFLGSIR